MRGFIAITAPQSNRCKDGRLRRLLCGHRSTKSESCACSWSDKKIALLSLLCARLSRWLGYDHRNPGELVCPPRARLGTKPISRSPKLQPSSKLSARCLCSWKESVWVLRDPWWSLLQIRLPVRDPDWQLLWEVPSFIGNLWIRGNDWLWFWLCAMNLRGYGWGWCRETV